MLQLVTVVTGLIAISFLCSVLESVILSISRPYIQTLIDKKMKEGIVLQKMKNNIEEPIAAILTLNTMSHTAGAAISGALAIEIFGSQWMGLFSAILTLLILVFSEIIPKTLGTRHWKSLSKPSAIILRIMILVLKPLIIPINWISELFARNNPGTLVSKAEIFNFARMGFRQGVLNSQEFAIIENLFQLKNKLVKDIFTPRTVVFTLPVQTKISAIKKNKIVLKFSRIPLYDNENNIVTGFVLRRDIMDHIQNHRTNKSLQEMEKKIESIPETITVLDLLHFLVQKNIHLAAVHNEYGDYIGVVTLEDALESLLGQEIVDEFDFAADMQQLAKKKAQNSKK